MTTTDHIPTIAETFPTAYAYITGDPDSAKHQAANAFHRTAATAYEPMTHKALKEIGKARGVLVTKTLNDRAELVYALVEKDWNESTEKAEFDAARSAAHEEVAPFLTAIVNLAETARDMRKAAADAASFAAKVNEEIGYGRAPRIYAPQWLTDLAVASGKVDVLIDVAMAATHRIPVLTAAVRAVVTGAANSGSYGYWWGLEALTDMIVNEDAAADVIYRNRSINKIIDEAYHVNYWLDDVARGLTYTVDRLTEAGYADLADRAMTRYANSRSAGVTA